MTVDVESGFLKQSGGDLLIELGGVALFLQFRGSPLTRACAITAS